jgi:hypothetical protein
MTIQIFSRIIGGQTVLIHQAYTNKLSVIIIAVLMLGLSVLWTTPGQTAPVIQFIGPQGGQIDARHNSYLVIPEGALGDATAALEILTTSVSLLDNQYDYIMGLSTLVNDPSGEWVKDKDKNPTRDKSDDVNKKVLAAKQKILEAKPEDAKNECNSALIKQADLRAHLDKILAEGKIGGVAYDLLQQQNDQIEGQLTAADSQLGQEIQADSFDIILDIEGLNSALALLAQHYDYMSQLNTTDDGSGEWLNDSATFDKNERVQDNLIAAVQYYNNDDDANTFKKMQEALGDLDVLDEHLVKKVNEGKLGVVASEIIQGYSDDARAAIDSVDKILVFEFGPCGTEFAIPAELVIPWDEILYNDALFWYSSGSSETLNLIDLEYVIDEVNETVHFFINHFSEYYYQRR